jgi:DNA-binding GntR family transcriptional regulator
MLTELRQRHERRKVVEMPLVRILGPDQTTADIDALFEIIDQMKDALRDAYCYLREHPKLNDETFDELINKVGRASE